MSEIAKPGGSAASVLGSEQLAHFLRLDHVHPLGQPDAIERTGENHRRNRDDQTEAEREAEIGVQRAHGDQRTRVRRQQRVQRRHAGQRGNRDTQDRLLASGAPSRR